MYQTSVPVFIHNLSNLSNILKKGSMHCEIKKIDQSVLINSRLFPDMFTLARQVQIASDVAKASVARIAEIEIPSFEDNESTFEQLQERITKTIAFLKTIKPEQVDKKEDLKINYHQRGKDYNFVGLPYLLNWAIPNLFFHITTTYSILRHNGVDVGKKDYLGEI